MEQSEVDKPVLTAFDKLSLLVIPQPAKKQLLPPRNQLVPYQLSHVVAIDDSDSNFFYMPMQEKRRHTTLPIRPSRRKMIRTDGEYLRLGIAYHPHLQ